MRNRLCRAGCAGRSRLSGVGNGDWLRVFEVPVPISDGAGAVGHAERPPSHTRSQRNPAPPRATPTKRTRRLLAPPRQNEPGAASHHPDQTNPAPPRAIPTKRTRRRLAPSRQNEPGAPKPHPDKTNPAPPRQETTPIRNTPKRNPGPISGCETRPGAVLLIV